MTEQNNNPQTFVARVPTGESAQITNCPNLLQSWDVNDIEATQECESNQKEARLFLGIKQSLAQIKT
jgi:hypothetical protein